MNKLMKHFKQKFIAVLMAVMCLTMIVPSGVTAFAAEPADDDMYAVTLADCDGGTVTFDDAEGDVAAFAEDEEVVLSVTPDDGYAFSGITLTLTDTGEVATEDDDVDDTVGYTFTMPAADITVTASFKEEDEADEGGIAAMSNNDIMTLSADMINYKTDTGSDYPDTLGFFTFDTSSDDFSYTTGSDVTEVDDVTWYDSDSVMYTVGFTTTVKTHDAFTIGSTDDPAFTVTQKKVYRLGGRWVDYTVSYDQIHISAHDHNESWGVKNVGDTIVIGGIYKSGGSNNGSPSFYTDYAASTTYDWHVEMTYDDTGETVDVPFNVIADDIDMGGAAGDMLTESWTFDDREYSRYDVYDDTHLVISYPSDYQTRFSADGEDIDYGGGDPQAEYAYTGVIAISNNGRFSGSTVAGGTNGSYLDVGCDYVLPNPEPEKTIIDGKTVHNAGETVSYAITFTMPEYMVDTYRTYESIVINDYIPNGLTYINGSSKVYSNGEDITDTAGELSYVDGDPELSGILTYTFNNEWLDNTDNYNGQEIKMTLDCTVDEGYNGETVLQNGVVEFDGVAYPVDVPTAISEPALSITKKADKTAYSLGDTVTYTITVNQTYPDAVAPNTVVTDTLPSELELVDVETNMGTATTDGNSFTVNVGDLWDTDTATITVTATAIKAAEDIENIAYASADDVPEVSDDAVINVRKPGLNIFKEADKDKFYPGDTVTYTIRVVNTNEEAAPDNADIDEADDTDGTDEDEDASDGSRVPTAYNVVVSDTLPDGLTLVSVVDDADGEIAIDGNSFTVSYPYMYYGEEHVITVEATVNEDVSNTTLHNVATVTSDNTDPVDDYADIDVVKPVLSIEKTADKDVYSVGDTVTYTIDVTQTVEGLTTENVVVTDTLPDEIGFVGAEITGVDGSVEATDNGFISDIPSLSYGETATFTVTGTALTPSTGVTNTVTATADHADEVNDDAVVDIVQPSLAIVKTADKDTCNTGDTVTFTVTVSETAEGATETNVVMTDPLPDGLTLSGTPSLSGVEGDVTVNGNTITADIPTLTYGEEAVITFQATVDDGYEGKTITNTAYVKGDHTDEISDDATIKVNEAEAVATPIGPKTGQSMAGIIAAIICGSALAMIVILVRRRRRI